MKKIILILSLILIAAGCNKTAQPTRDTVSNQPEDKTSDTPNLTSYKISVIALDDNGKTGKKIGCNDSAILLPRTTGFTTQPLNAAMKDLFSLSDTKVKDASSDQEFYNVISLMQKNSDPKNNLTFQSATIDANGTAKIFLGGQMT